MGSQARVYHHQHPVFIRAQISYNTAGIATGVVIGHIPAGAILKPLVTVVRTAFNASLTNPINVGVIQEVSGQPVAPITPQTQIGVVPGGTAGRASTPTATPANVVAATDQALVVSYVPTGTAGTAGVIDVILEYVPNL